MNCHSTDMQRTAILKLIAREALASSDFARTPEPELIMSNSENVDAFDGATAQNGPNDGLHAFIMLHASTVLNGAHKVLDLGCGSAQLLLKLASLHPESSFTGVDLSEAMLESAEKNRQALGLQNVRFLKQDICRLESFADQSQDAVISSQAMHHLPDVEHLRQMLFQVRRVACVPRRLFFFDLGRLKKLASIHDIVRQFHELPEVLKNDFDASLKAAFSPKELTDTANQVFSQELKFYRMALVPLYMLLKTDHHQLSPQSKALWDKYYQSLTASTQQDFIDLSRFFRLKGLHQPT
jgi:arsenite methyltransferase